jgi:succinate dehydrogenase / fumarate reductase flavoprotein subunit
VADFLELGELMCRDALAREESCGCHFRVEHQTPDGEARRDDGGFAHVTAWRPGASPRCAEPVIEPLEFETMPPSERSYR